MARNKAVITKAVEDYKNRVIIPTMEARLKSWCSQILDASLLARQRDPKAHNFTGNLLNSIVVCLYRNKEPVMAWFASDRVPEAIVPKMKKRQRKRVFFSRDYDGTESAYLPTVETNGGWGKDDAQNFFENYVPKGNNLFDVVIAYPVEYADWVQMHRATTGILNAYQYVERTGMRFMKLK